MKGTTWFRGAMMRATWDATRFWALIPSVSHIVPVVPRGVGILAASMHNGGITAHLLSLVFVLGL